MWACKNKYIIENQKALHVHFHFGLPIHGRWIFHEFERRKSLNKSSNIGKKVNQMKQFTNLLSIISYVK